jgi:hypothetical protein
MTKKLKGLYMKRTQIIMGTIVACLLTASALFAESASVNFLGVDTDTRGKWNGVYGTDGYDIAGIGSKLPSYAKISYKDCKDFAWAETTDVRALQRVGDDQNCVAACKYGSGFTIDVTVEGEAKTVSFYCLDWDTTDRSMTIQAIDPENKKVLNEQTVKNFHDGIYLSYTVKGHVQFKITKVTGENIVISGVFFGKK